MITGVLDQTYLHLFREYTRALSQWRVAVEDRQRRLAAKEAWDAVPHPRRPVGAHADFVIPPASELRTPKPSPLPRYYMGRILGWVEFQHTSTREEMPDPLASLDVGAVFDEIALKGFIRTREQYIAARKALADHVHRRNQRNQLSRMDAHHRKARAHALDAGRAQQLGGDGAAELDAMRSEVEEMCEQAWAAYGVRTLPGTSPREHRAQAAMLLGAAQKANEVGSEVAAELMLLGVRKQLDAACEKAWEIYQRTPPPKGEDDLRRMLESLQEAQLQSVTSPTVSAMELELTRMLRAPGRLEPPAGGAPR
jgi:hypothetical protein